MTTDNMTSFPPRPAQAGPVAPRPGGYEAPARRWPSKRRIALAVGVAAIVTITVWGVMKVTTGGSAGTAASQSGSGDASQSQSGVVSAPGAKSQKAPTQADVANLQSTIAAIDQQRAVLEGQLATAKTDYATLQSSFIALDQRKADVQDQLASVQFDYTNLQSSIGGLTQRKADLQNQLAAVQADEARLVDERSKLTQTISTLQAQLATANTDLAKAQTDAQSLQGAVTAAKQQTSDLQQAQTDLLAKYNALAKAKVFAAAPNLQVTFNTEDQFLSTKWLAGQVTNTGTATVAKAYIFVARFKDDGSLDKMDFPPYLATNLKPGGTANFSFLTAGEAFKIVVVADN
ncbi:MAG: hypothetical protein HY261_08860 [Chloroflexi bacterium]|nr:hypothetical protein [Chloroflexota bacterium]